MSGQGRFETGGRVRVGLGILEVVVGLAALGGGLALMRNGAGIPDEWLEPTPFHSWVLPGLALLVIIGGSELVAAWSALRHRPDARFWSLAAGLVLVVWIAVQVLVLRRFHVMQPVMFGIGTVIALVAYRFMPAATKL